MIFLVQWCLWSTGLILVHKNPWQVSLTGFLFAANPIFFFRSYNAEVAYIDVPNGVTNMVCINNFWKFWRRRHPDRMICRVNCPTCSNNSEPFNFADAQWQRSRGRYISVGASINSCRNEMAPDGLVADAHLSDGFLHLVLIKNCSRPKYLW